MNLLPTKSNKDYINPYKVLSRVVSILNPKPNIKHLRTYYYIAYYYIKKEKRVQGNKFTKRSK
ncbi:hypothetical protein B0H65DRAFT_437492 [Neurospora tetraspora]|uniref:Uncharacterized protein n=1 Tax=Neurospora tetraspora TaxID=94610 RepID=A0AAE0MJ98_9PEZI|nr:hypothetical protein B0H65DRAFT_437492 [Neurospora tetraspora]